MGCSASWCLLCCMDNDFTITGVPHSAGLRENSFIGEAVEMAGQKTNVPHVGIRRQSMEGKHLLSGAKRLLFGLSIPAAAVLLIIYEAGGGTGMTCPFYRMTGLYCPGCGSGRAVRALLEGRIWASFCCNPLLWLLGPPAMACVLREYLRVLFPSLGWKPLILSQRLVIGAAIIVFAFWFLRNLPGFSFLAPSP